MATACPGLYKNSGRIVEPGALAVPYTMYIVEPGARALPYTGASFACSLLETLSVPAMYVATQAILSPRFVMQ